MTEYSLYCILIIGLCPTDESDMMLFIETDYLEEPLLLFDINPTCKVVELKGRIEDYWRWLKYFVYELLFSRKILKENSTLKSHGIKDRAKIVLPRVKGIQLILKIMQTLTMISLSSKEETHY